MTDPQPTPDEQNTTARVRVEAADPDTLLRNLRDDAVYHTDAVGADTAPQFRAWFSDAPPAAGFEPGVRMWSADNPPVLAMEWTFSGRHVTPFAFNDIHATGREVLVRGCTVFASQGGELSVRRYIDWVGLYAQLGISVNWRVPIDTDEAPTFP